LKLDKALRKGDCKETIFKELFDKEVDQLWKDYLADQKKDQFAGLNCLVRDGCWRPAQLSLEKSSCLVRKAFPCENREKILRSGTFSIRYQSS
jgi:hypothetical protein